VSENSKILTNCHKILIGLITKFIASSKFDGDNQLKWLPDDGVHIHFINLPQIFVNNHMG
jgi:hypothetical protein